jgi:alkylation response protein AidB-like acyl-CoA dehydrogenase
MNFELDEDHTALREAIGEVTRSFGDTYYAERAERHQPTQELWSALGRQGFIGINTPEEFGGGGAGMTELALVCEETAANGAPLLLLLVSSAISAEVIARYGTAEQKSTWLPKMASGESKVVFAITEPESGSNTLTLSTTATRDGDGWLLNGSKYYISGVDEADAILIVARTGTDASTGRAQLSLFIMPTDAEGFVAQPLPVSAALPERQFTLFFDNVRLEQSQLVGVEHEGFAQVFHGLNPERITGAAICIGVGRYVLKKAAAYATSRQVWGVPIATHQGISHALAKAKIEIEIAALMTSKAAWLHDQGLPAGEASNMAKYAAAEAAFNAVDAAIQTHGGNGLSTEYGLVPMWGMVRLLRIAPVSREMVLNFVAQHSLGLPRSY